MVSSHFPSFFFSFAIRIVQFQFLLWNTYVLIFVILCPDPSNVSSALLRTKVIFKCYLFFCWAVRFSPGQDIFEKALSAGRQKWMWNECFLTFSPPFTFTPEDSSQREFQIKCMQVSRPLSVSLKALVVFVGSLEVGYSQQVLSSLRGCEDLNELNQWKHLLKENIGIGNFVVFKETPLLPNLKSHFASIHSFFVVVCFVGMYRLLHFQYWPIQVSR